MKTRLLLTAAFVICAWNAASSQDWETYYEKSNFLETPRYAETIEYCKRLAAASPWAEFRSFGTSPQGRDLPLLILSADGAFTPADARKTGKAIVLIQSGIHSGEIDGKDASLMLARDILITKRHVKLLENAIVLVVPIFNVDGHERFGPYNRINQNGPKEMGWRVTAQNFNLNRDYLKADAPEMRAMLSLFTDWLPDFYVDCHVTDGMDFQYDVTYAMEVYPNIDPEVARWIQRQYLPPMISSVEASGHLIAPYIWPREYNDISKGFISSAADPRFSTGYGATQNRPTLLIETHMLKPYKTRVSATYHILLATLEIVNRQAELLRTVVREADERVEKLPDSKTPYLPLSFRPTRASVDWTFRGLKTRTIESDITGSSLTTFSTEPEVTTVPYFAGSDVVDSVRVPRYYIIPQEWSEVIEVLHAHGLRMRRLVRPVELKARISHLSDARWQERPYEGHHPVRVKNEESAEDRMFPAGSVVVPVGQRAGKIAVHLLEPQGPDSFVRWGFFDSIFEQKEYAEAYVMESIAREMLERDPQLREEFTTRVASDSAFAKSPWARINFFYQRSPYWDDSIGLYPVARVDGEIDQSLLR